MYVVHMVKLVIKTFFIDLFHFLCPIALFSKQMKNQFWNMVFLFVTRAEQAFL